MVEHKANTISSEFSTKSYDESKESFPTSSNRINAQEIPPPQQEEEVLDMIPVNDMGTINQEACERLGCHSNDLNDLVKRVFKVCVFRKEQESQRKLPLMEGHASLRLPVAEGTAILLAKDLLVTNSYLLSNCNPIDNYCIMVNNQASVTIPLHSSLEKVGWIQVEPYQATTNKELLFFKTLSSPPPVSISHLKQELSPQKLSSRSDTHILLIAYPTIQMGSTIEDAYESLRLNKGKLSERSKLYASLLRRNSDRKFICVGKVTEETTTSFQDQNHITYDCISCSGMGGGMIVSVDGTTGSLQFYGMHKGRLSSGTGLGVTGEFILKSLEE